MRRIGGNLNCVFVSVVMVFENRAGAFRLLQKTLRSAAAQIDHARNAGAHADLHHVQYILHDVEIKVILLLKARGGDADGDAAVGQSWTENWHASFVR